MTGGRHGINDPRFKPNEQHIYIMQELANGATYKEIGDALFLTPEGVRGRLVNLVKRHGTANRIALIAHAMRKGWIE